MPRGSSKHFARRGSARYQREVLGASAGHAPGGQYVQTVHEVQQSDGADPVLWPLRSTAVQFRVHHASRFAHYFLLLRLCH